MGIDELREHYDSTDTSEELADAVKPEPVKERPVDWLASAVADRLRLEGLRQRIEELAEHLDVLADAWDPRPGIGLGACERDQRRMVSGTYRYNALLVRGLLDG